MHKPDKDQDDVDKILAGDTGNDDLDNMNKPDKDTDDVDKILAGDTGNDDLDNMNSQEDDDLMDPNDIDAYNIID